MIIPYQNIKLNLEHFSEFNPAKKTILFLHGFTGSANDWNVVSDKIDKRFNKIGLDLIGHGKSGSPSELKYYQIDSMVDQIEETIRFLGLNKVVLCGYSMGGRVGLKFALDKQNLLSGIILESSSAGIKKMNERLSRKQNDDELANFIMNNPIEEFITRWLDQEIFGTIKRFSNEKIKRIKEEKMKSSRIGLANSLLGYGTGVMPYLGSELITLKIPVLLISGGLDDKFTQLNQSLRKLIPSARHKVIANAGHNTHLEEPAKFISIVNQFLKKL